MGCWHSRTAIEAAPYEILVIIAGPIKGWEVCPRVQHWKQCCVTVKLD